MTGSQLHKCECLYGIMGDMSNRFICPVYAHTDSTLRFFIQGHPQSVKGTPPSGLWSSVKEPGLLLVLEISNKHIGNHVLGFI